MPLACMFVSNCNTNGDARFRFEYLKELIAHMPVDSVNNVTLTSQTHAHTCEHKLARTHAHTRTDTHTHTNTHRRTHTHAHTHAHKHIHKHAQTHTHTDTHTHTHARDTSY